MIKYLLLLFLLSSSSLFATESKTDTWSLSSQHHIVDVPIPDNMKIPKDFILSQHETLQCSTCHKADVYAEFNQFMSSFVAKGTTTEYRALVDRLKNYDIEAPDFLRRDRATELSEFCYRCHTQEDNKPKNFHIMLDKENLVIEKKCTYCHSKELNPDDYFPRKNNSNTVSNDFYLRLPKEKICIGCHLETPHLNARLHQVKLNDQMLKRLKQYEIRNDIRFPLTSDQEITCITCHNAHQKGVLNKSNPVAKQAGDGNLKKGIEYKPHSWSEIVVRDKAERLDKIVSKHEVSYQQITYEVLLRLPAKNGELCFACHKFDQ